MLYRPELSQRAAYVTQTVYLILITWELYMLPFKAVSTQERLGTLQGTDGSKIYLNSHLS